MVDVIGYVMVALLIISFTYGLLRQIQHTLAIQNANKTDVSNYKRALFGNYIVCIYEGDENHDTCSRYYIRSVLSKCQ